MPGRELMLSMISRDQHVEKYYILAATLMPAERLLE